MAEIIDFTQRLHRNLIASDPIEFRRGDWQTGKALMCLREESIRYEEHRKEALRAPGHQHIGFVPNHFALDGGYHFTVMGLFRYRNDEALMRRVYRLAGLMECVMNAPSAILRSDLLRRFYKTITDERDTLRVVWRGNAHHFLLPLHPDLHNPNLFMHGVSRAESLKELYEAIEAETNTQFDVISKHYVIYMPEGIVALD